MAVLFLAAPAVAKLIDHVLAIVAGQVVTLSDAHAALAVGLVEAADDADPIGTAMSALIERHLVIAEADRYAVPEPDDAELQRRVEALRSAVVARAGGRSVAEPGPSDQRLVRLARDDLRIRTYLEQRFSGVQPTEAEVEAYYEEHPDQFTSGGIQRPFLEVQADVRQRVADEQRQALIAGWIADLRGRADVNVLYLPDD
jgi:hypothetical protein